MSVVARAAAEYREAVNSHRAAKRALELQLAYAHRREGRSVADLAAESGYSRQRIYQLLATKKEKAS